MSGEDEAFLLQLGHHARQRRDAFDGRDASASELLTPLTVAARARMVDAIQAIQAQSRSDARSSSHIRRAHSRRRSTWLTAGASGMAAAAATAAAVAIYLSTATTPTTNGTGDNAAVAYVLEIEGGDEPTRASAPAGSSTAAKVPVLEAESRVEIRARPQSATAVGKAAAYVRASGESRAVLVAAAPEISAQGVVRWRGTAQQLFGGRRGELHIRVEIGGDEHASGHLQTLAGRIRVGTIPAHDVP